MKYFRMSLEEAGKVTQMVWNAQRQAGQALTAFSIAAAGTDASVWTTDPRGESMLRDALAALSIPCEEGNEQQVYTGFEKYW